MNANGSSEPLTILMIGNFLSSWLGTRSVCEDLAEKFQDAGIPVITTSNRKSRVARMWDILGTIWKNQKRFDIAQIDVYSGLAFFWAEAACFMLRQLRKPYILSLHGGNLPLFAGRFPGRVKALLQSAAAVTSPSPYLKEQMNSYCDTIQLLPNPLNLMIYRFIQRTQAKPRLVWLRAFHEVYNPSLAAEVVSLLRKDFPDVSLTMIGPDKDQISLRHFKERVKVLGIENQVTVVGRIDKTEISDYLNKNDIFLNTSNVDNAPVSVLEAMACGLCIVSTNVGGIPYLLSHEKNALLVSAANPEAMAGAVRRILLNARLASELSQNAFANSEKSNWKSVFPLWKKIFSVMIESGKVDSRLRSGIATT